MENDFDFTKPLGSEKVLPPAGFRAPTESELSRARQLTQIMDDALKVVQDQIMEDYNSCDEEEQSKMKCIASTQSKLIVVHMLKLALPGAADKLDVTNLPKLFKDQP